MADEQAYAAAAKAVYSSKSGVAPDLTPLGSVLIGEYEQAKLDRRETELRWLKDLRQFKGKYEPEEEAAMGKRSKSFVRKTRVKVKTINSRLTDLLFPTGKEKNWSVTETPVATIDREMRSTIGQQLAQTLQRNPTDDELKKAVQNVSAAAAKRMSSVIEDQLVESRYKKSAVKAINSGNLYGTGILKGPLVERKVRTRYVKKAGKWTERNEYYIVPFVDFVPLWRFYPDMGATEIDQCRFTYERHLMIAADFAKLGTRKTFKTEIIKAHILANPNGLVTKEHFDDQLKSLGERESKHSDERGLFEVIERWGWLTCEQLCQCGVPVPANRMHESFFANVWLLPDGQIVKAVLQPINGVTWPYHFYYFDKDESSIFAEGLSAIMRDDQSMLNAAVRMMLDNGAITSGPQLEVVTDLLSSLENINEIVPWKVWPRKKGDGTMQAIRAIDIPNHLEDMERMARMFDSNADETTAIPRYMSGENSTNGAAGTASGMSMLMGAANIVVKDLVTSWDEGITRTFLLALYRWNMQFNKDDSIKGDFDVNAMGTASLVAKEIRAQALGNFAVATNNPTDLPLIKRDSLLRQIAEAQELSDVVKSVDEIKSEQESDQAKQMAQMQQQMREAQLGEAMGKARNLMAQAELAIARAKESESRVAQIVAQIVETKVATIYAALQAGGAATATPFVAPAGDEVLKSAGFKDATPEPGIDALNGPPVQAEPGTVQVLNKGASFAVQPRGVDPVAPAIPAGPGVGEHEGIETPAVTDGMPG